MVNVKKLTEEEEEIFKIWREQFLEEGDSLRRMGWKWVPSGWWNGQIKAGAENLHSQNEIEARHF